MEPRPPKPPRSNPRQQQPQQPQQPSWNPNGQPGAQNQPPVGNSRDGGYPGSNRYPEYPPYDQQPGYGRGNQPPAYPPASNYPGQGQGYGQQPADPYGNYQRPPAYPPGTPQQGGYPGNQPDPYAGYPGQQIYPPQQGNYQPTNQASQGAVQVPGGRSGSGGWIAPLPDEDLSSIQPSSYGGGYGGGGFSGDPRSSRPLPGPKPNRQTQIIAALAIGGLALMILAIVIGFIVFGGDDGKNDNDSNNAANVPGVTSTATTTTGAAPTATTAGEIAPPPTETATATATATETAVAGEPTVEPTQAPTDTTQGDTAAVFNGDNGLELLPDPSELPDPYFVINTIEADQRYNRSEVADSLGDSDGSIDAELRANRFDSNWRRQFVVDSTSTDPGATDPSKTSAFFVSASVFRSVEGAANSLSIYTSSAAAIGYEEIDGEQLGDQSVVFRSSDGGNAIVYYILKDNVIFRIYGLSVDGDPTADVVALAQTVLDKLAAAE